MSTIGDNIRTARKALKMSQDELAEAIGANRVTISKYENGGYLYNQRVLLFGRTPYESKGRGFESPRARARECRNFQGLRCFLLRPGLV